MIIKQREHVTVTSYSLEYVWNDCATAGFGFECNEKGLLLPKNERALENFIDCITGKNDVTYNGIRTYTHSYTESAILKCECGSHVHLSGFTNTCDCGRDYNFGGQLLADRSQWGYETGEHWTECY